MNPIDFGGQRTKVKVTIGIYGNKLVNTIETKPLCISLSNFADMLTMVRGMNPIYFGGQRSKVKASVCVCVCLSDSHTFLIVTHSYVTI